MKNTNRTPSATVAAPTFATVASLYRAGSLGHGVLAFLSEQVNAKTGLIEGWFPSIHGSSLLTHLRRQGLIEQVERGRYAITDLGRELLAVRGEYTVAMYVKSNQWRSAVVGLKTVPWKADAKTQKKTQKKIFTGTWYSC